MGESRTYHRDRARTFLISIFIFLCLSSFSTGQNVKVRVINGANGHPLQKQAVSVSILYDKQYDKNIPAKYEPVLNLETDANGEAYFNFPEPAPGHFAVQVRVDWSRWHCGCGVMASTDDLIKNGVMGFGTTTTNNSLAYLKPMPRQILIVARPLSFWERLLYPLVKQ
jgi:hypothetical protein